MKIKKPKDEIQKYSVIQNINFTFANVWRWDKSFYIGFIPKIFLSVLLPLATIYFPRVMIDMITRKSPQNELLLFVGVFCVLFALLELVSIFIDAKIYSMRDIFRNQYEDICEKKYKLTDYQNTEDPQINDLYNNAMNSTGYAESMVDTLNNFFMNLLGIISFGSIIIILNPIILIIILACTVVNFFLFKIVRMYTNKNWRKWAPVERKNNYLHSITHCYEKIKDIKLYPYPRLINDLTDKCHKERLYWRGKVWNKESLPSIVDTLLAFLRNGVVYYILLAQLINGYIDVGLFVFYFGAVTGFSEWLNSVSGQLSNILQISTRINFIRSFMEIDERFNRGITKRKPEGTTYDIEIKNLTFSYHASETNIMKNISIKINKGEKIALVGSNGAGKTTMVKLICGLYYPKEGDILINGLSVKEINIDEYYALFSVVFQDFHLMPISFAQFVSGSGVDIDRQKVQKCLEQAGLSDRVGRCPRGIDTTFYKDIHERDPGVDLSGGEKQRLLLARALYKDASILILDEPTAALDPIAESEMYQKFDELIKGKTAIYISHRLASTRFCDRIFFMEDGQIIECGSHEQLMEQKGKYYEMFEVQSYYYKEEVPQ